MDEEAIFAAALEKSTPAERDAFLDRACSGNPELRENLVSLLEAYGDGEFLESPSRLAVTLDSPPVAERPGAVIGRYKLLQEIGEGGMGVVYMAEQQEPLRRKVALKVIKPGMDTREVIARFEAERQTLALMDHPNIAHVLDAGAAESGRPYFVMELVHGIPIVDYCDQNHLTTLERLALFILVCQAVQHAHQKGIIHRDIKPTNVMITLHDGVPVPKVIDFGVAKAINQRLTEKTAFTHYGQMVGTPLYMSPEQAEMSGLDVDTRSDIYSLGVLLYELLTGATPFDQERLREAGYEEICSIIRSAESPKPSIRISTMGKAATTVSAHRKTDPAKLSQMLRGELDCIVMKALEKDRTRRYETASDFVRDIRRYLNDEPVEARPASAAYRFRKFAHRNKTVLAVTAIVGAALVIGAGLAAWQADRATRAWRAEQKSLAEVDRQRRQAEADLSRALQAAARLQGVAERLLRRPETSEVGRELVENALQLCQTLLDEHGQHPEVRRRTALAYLQISRLHISLKRNTQAKDSLQRAIAIFESLADERPDWPLAIFCRADLTGCYVNLSAVLADEDQLERAVAVGRRAERLLVELAQDFQREGDRRKVQHRLGKIRGNLAGYLADLGRPEEAEKAYREASAIQRALLDRWPEATEYRAYLAWSESMLGELLCDHFGGRLDEAEPMLRGALRFEEEAVKQSPETAEYRSNLAQTQRRLGKLLAAKGVHDQAEQAYREAASLQQQLAQEYPHVVDYRGFLAGTLVGLGRLLCDTGRFPEGSDQYRKVIDLGEQLLREFPKDPGRKEGLAEDYSNLGNTLVNLGRLQDAEEPYQRALALQQELTRDHPDVSDYQTGLAATCDNLGILYAKLKQNDKAQQFFQRALDIGKQLVERAPHAEEHKHNLARIYNNFGGACGDDDEAEKALLAALAIHQDLAEQVSRVPAHRQTLLDSWNNLGVFYENRDRLEEAESCYVKALAVQEALAKSAPDAGVYEMGLAQIHFNWAELHEKLGRPDKAAAAYQQVADILEKPAYAQQPGLQTFLAAAYACLGKLQTDAGQYAEGVGLCQKGRDILEKLLDDHPGLPDIRQELAYAHCKLARILTNFPDVKRRDTHRALTLAQQAVELAPDDKDVLSTLGLALYREGKWEEAVAALDKRPTNESDKNLAASGDGGDGFLLAMARWRLGQKEEARNCYDEALSRIAERNREGEETLRLRREAAELMGIPARAPATNKETKQQAPIASQQRALSRTDETGTGQRGGPSVGAPTEVMHRQGRWIGTESTRPVTGKRGQAWWAGLHPEGMTKR